MLDSVQTKSAQNGLLERVFSEIPLDSHPVGNEVMEYLENKEPNDHNSATLNIDSNINHIDITLSWQPQSPMVVDSNMETYC